MNFLEMLYIKTLNRHRLVVEFLACLPSSVVHVEDELYIDHCPVLLVISY